jgi:predicted dehydrogenase
MPAGGACFWADCGDNVEPVQTEIERAMDKLRLGFIGVGNMGQCAHLRNYSTLGDCQVVALAEIRQDLGRDVAARYGIPRVYPDHRQLLASEKLDGIVCIQPFYIHGSLLPEVLAAGVPAIIEKPLARSVEMARKVLSAQQKGGGPLYVAYHKRSDPATMFVKRQIEAWRQSGEMGKLKYVRLTMPPGDWIAGGFSQLIDCKTKVPAMEMDPTPAGMDAATAGRLDAFVNYYIHQVNLLRHLFGEDYQVTFADACGVTMSVRSAGGVSGVLEMAPYRNTIDWQEQALVCFERGWIRLELPPPLATDRAGRVTVYADPSTGVSPMMTSPTLPHVHAMRQQAMNFLAALRGEKTPLCGPADAVKDLEVAEEYIRQYVRTQG